MIAETYRDLLTRFGVEPSYSRPRVSNSNNASMASISLDIAPVATCPSTARLALAQALTKSVDYLQHLRSNLEIEYNPLMRLP